MNPFWFLDHFNYAYLPIIIAAYLIYKNPKRRQKAFELWDKFITKVENW